MDEFRTSRYLHEHLLSLDQDYSVISEETASERLSGDDRALLQKLQAMLVESYESLSTRECERVHFFFRKSPDACKYELDDYFARFLVSQVPDIVKRVMQFEPVAISKAPGAPANVYLREAMRCYFFGLHQGAVTLARAAVEQALREQVPYARVNDWTLDALIDAAGRFKVLSPEHQQLATDVQHIGNKALHREPCSPHDASEVLVKTRITLLALYGEQR